MALNSCIHVVQVFYGKKARMGDGGGDTAVRTVFFAACQEFFLRELSVSKLWMNGQYEFYLG